MEQNRSTALIKRRQVFSLAAVVSLVQGGKGNPIFADGSMRAQADAAADADAIQLTCKSAAISI